MNLDTDERRIDMKIDKNLHASNAKDIISLSIQVLLF